MKLYSIFDSRAEKWSAPMALDNVASAFRGFDQAVNDPSTDLNRYAEDYTLFELAEFDEVDGVLKPYESPISVAKAIGLRKEVNS